MPEHAFARCARAAQLCSLGVVIEFTWLARHCKLDTRSCSVFASLSPLPSIRLPDYSPSVRHEPCAVLMLAAFRDAVLAAVQTRYNMDTWVRINACACRTTQKGTCRQTCPCRNQRTGQRHACLGGSHSTCRCTCVVADLSVDRSIH